MKKIIKKGIAILLLVVMMTSNSVTVLGAVNPFSIQEIYGSEGKIYVTVKDNVPLRSSPSNEGTILKRLEKNYPIEAKGLFQTNKKTRWIQIETLDHGEAWIFIGNLSEHNHTYNELDPYGYEGFSFCTGCGNVTTTRVDALRTSYDDIHILLSCLSLLPVAGNAFDILDGLVSITEGDLVGAGVSFAAAIPVFGSIGNALKTGKVIPVIETADTVIAAQRIGDGIEVFEYANYKKLNGAMDKRYTVARERRYFKDYTLPKRSVAGHHIVAANAKEAAESRILLNYLEIGINSVENGVYLCLKEETCVEGVIHSTSHSKLYYETVNSMLKKAFNNAPPTKVAQREAVINELDKIANMLLDDELAL